MFLWESQMEKKSFLRENWLTEGLLSLGEVHVSQVYGCM